MDYFYNCTPTRQFVIYKTHCGCVGYGWPLPDLECCHGKRRRRRKRCFKHFNLFRQYPYCKDFSCLAPFWHYSGFPGYGFRSFDRDFGDCCD